MTKHNGNHLTKAVCDWMSQQMTDEAVWDQMINRGQSLMKADGVWSFVGTANDWLWERDEELHLKGVRFEEQTPHWLSLNPLLPHHQQLFKPLITMSSPCFSHFSNKSWGKSVMGLSISRTDMCCKLEDMMGGVPYPWNANVSPIELLFD